MPGCSTSAERLTAAVFAVGLLLAGCATRNVSSGFDGGSGTGGTGGGASSGSCTQDADCGTSSACATHHCGPAGTCSHVDAPAGTSVPGGQVPGDCKTIVCDGAGGITTVPDDTDTQDDGNPCTLDKCSNGDALHPAVPWGTSCGAGLVCNAKVCTVGCIIDASFHAAGAADFEHPCWMCDPAVSTSTWTLLADGATCDDGDPCTGGDHCAGGACAGTPTSCTTDCFATTCDGNGNCATVDMPDGTLCTGTTELFGNVYTFPGVCLGGDCADGCFVDGHFYADKQYSLDAQVCLSCDPLVSRTSLYVGGCHTGTQWGGPFAGTCGGDGICYLATPDCQCTDCSVQPCSGALCFGLPMSPTTPCAGDGDPCTIDHCNGHGGCIHTPAPEGTSCGSGLICHGLMTSQCSAGCFIGGAFSAPGAAKPGDPCQICDPVSSTSAWTSQSPCP